MTELDVPIRRSLREPSFAVDAVWARIAVARERGTPVWTQVAGLAGALAAVFVIAAWAAMQVLPRLETRHAAVTAGPLLRANGEALGVLDTSGSGAALDIALSDGSCVRLEPGAKLVPKRSDARAFRAVVACGTVVFDVKPGGARRWTIDALDTRVEVVGTRFSVTNEAGQVTVRVDRGLVHVEGPRVPDGVQALGGGERLVIAPPPSAASAEPRSEVGAAPPRAEPEPVASPEPSAEWLLKSADTARAAGDYRRAARILQRFLAAYPSDEQAAIVALTLGRIQLEQLNAPKAAASAFARANALGLPDAVAEEGAARLVEAYAKSGDKEKARAAAIRYARRFPAGVRSEHVAAWLDLE